MTAGTRHHRACNLCEAICGLTITLDGDRVADLRGDPDDPLSAGAICPKATALTDMHADPQRLRGAVQRDGNAWRPIAWDDAFELVAERLRDVESRYGRDSIAIYLGNPTVHNSGTLLSMGGFLRAFRTRNRFSATSVDQLPHHAAALDMFGHPMLLPVPDVDRTDYFLVLGANPLVSNGSIMTAPGMAKRMKALQARGGRIVVFDPRRTETARAADEHAFVRPGSDALLLAALIEAIFSAGLAKLGAIAAYASGFDELHDAVRAFPAERVAERTGVDAATIRRVALEFAHASSAVAYGRVGLSTQAFGGLCQWLLAALNAVTGNLDRAGGMMWPLPAFDLLHGAKPGETHAGRWTSRVRSLPEFNGELPVATMADEMIVPGEGQVRALVTIAGNPVLSTPNGARLDRALANLDFVVAVDPYLNETTRHAHLILPPATGLEVAHYDVIFHHFAVRNTARYSEPLFPIGDDQRFDWQIFAALRERLDGKPTIPPHERLDAGLRAGPRRTSLEELRAHPHGIDYGPLAPIFPERLLTADRRVHLAPAAFVADLARLEAELAKPVPDLVLIGRRNLRSNNSWMNGVARLARGPERCTLLVNERDAAARGIASGDEVRVESRAGTIAVRAEVTADVMPGVVSLPHGFGAPRASYNDLTDPEFVDELTGNAALNGVPVRVTAPTA